MDEHFLHYIWKYQKLNANSLILEDGSTLSVFFPGHHNQDSGPDFEEARIKINDIEWAGQVEIHIRSSDWDRHKHGLNPAYNNVILHVVWSHDTDIQIEAESLPVLELQNLVDLSLISRYKDHVNSSKSVACGSRLNSKHELAYFSMLDKVLVERLERKSSEILEKLSQNKNDWEEVCYQALAKNFGFSTNKSAFELLSKRLPFSILKKNLQDINKTEALIFGQAGFLGKPIDHYQSTLKKEYNYLTSKYKLPGPLEIQQWKFGRMRPANFPTVRLAQFSSLLHQHPKLFSDFISIKNPKEIISLLAFELPKYWLEHYDFDKKRTKSEKSIGQQSLDTLLINTVAPLLAAYSKYTDNLEFMNRAISILENTPPERNRITKEWVALNKTPKTAFESQGQIQLFNEYCKKRKCLSCNVGVEILSK